MNTHEAATSGVLVLRGWVEPEGQLRVRATSMPEPPAGQASTGYAASRAEVLLLVSAWLDELAPPEPR